MSQTLETANQEQRAASDPAVSAFVAAAAGTGKTKLLTDRLLRLMLAGTAPEKILCLTYTKAAAAEMAIRLNHRLGAWVAMPDARLGRELAEIGAPDTQRGREQARKMFADVLDAPGGMRINTIHAFCQSLLRRFPLEAGLSPHFELADDRQAALRLREARETVLGQPLARGPISHLAGATDERQFAALTSEFHVFGNVIERLRQQFGGAGLAAMQAAAMGAGARHHDEILRGAVEWGRETHLRPALHRLAQAGTKTGQDFATGTLAWLAQAAAARALNWVAWRDGFFTADGGRRSTTRLIGRALAAAHDELHGELEAEQARIEAVEEARKAARLNDLNQAVFTLIMPILTMDSSQARHIARLRYGDLIARTSELLTDPGAAWVLYKLDGGIEHLLLDEVQDTAPAQWRIAEQIADEFFAGAGARTSARSIFAVGDPKQSIFSFQGADLQSFAQYRQKFRARVTGAGQAWLDGALSVSFRSTAPVLALVDAVFAQGPARAGVCEADSRLAHGVARAGQAGRVSLWPLVPAPAAPDVPGWAVPDEYQPSETARAQLAREIVDYIEALLRAKTMLPSRDRAVSPGDILILVRSRTGLGDAITSLCKARRIPIAGQDRLQLTGAQAVSDLLALCDSLLLPDDDLAFGQYLASPLGGLSDDSLMALGLGRRGTLAAALFARRAERADWLAAQQFFEALRARADFITPHALLAQALGPLGGRARLMRRLGAEAGEPMDELLAEALNYTRLHPPSLQGFLHDLRQSGASIKREADAAGGQIRIMTVHGAKGLQAPIVILPDTTALPQDSDKLLWLRPPQQPDVSVPVFCPRKELRTQAVTDALAVAKAARLAEYHRLLYVALTRAEDELIICGADSKKKRGEQTWYEAVEAGFSRLPLVAAEANGRRHYATGQEAAPDKAAVLATAAPARLPGWAGAPPDWRAQAPVAEAGRPEPLAPSRGNDDDAKQAIAASPLGGPAAARDARARALAKGRATHALLQHLPDLPAAARAVAAAKYLARLTACDASAQAEIIDAVMNVLALPALAPLFGPGSRAEVPLAGVVGDVEIGGLVDRLAVRADEILLADYKTDHVPPATVRDIPSAYLRQLAAYGAILAQIYPGRKVTCVLIFTRTGAVMAVPPGLLASHAPA